MDAFMKWRKSIMQTFTVGQGPWKAERRKDILWKHSALVVNSRHTIKHDDEQIIFQARVCSDNHFE